MVRWNKELLRGQEDDEESALVGEELSESDNDESNAAGERGQSRRIHNKVILSEIQRKVRDAGSGYQEQTGI